MNVVVEKNKGMEQRRNHDFLIASTFPCLYST